MCKNCKCQECNPPPPPPSVTGTVSADKGTPFNFTRADLLVYPNEEDGRYRFVLTGWAKIGDLVVWNLTTIASTDHAKP